MEIENISGCSKWTVYGHISPSDKVYIGITCNKDVNKRWKYGHGWNIIASDPGEREQESNKAKGTSYNITDGGEGYLGGTHMPSEETGKLLEI